MDRSETVSLGGQEYVVLRARLGKYLILQASEARLEKAVSKSDTGAIVRAIYSYLQVAIPELTWEQYVAAAWYEIIHAYSSILLINVIKADLAILKQPAGNGKLSVPWDYEDRPIYFWVHLIADAYHWSKEDIENLWPEEAVAFIQEIVADQQYNREFLHSLSEISYRYEKATKTSKYVPLHRPIWMVARDPKTLITKLHRSMVPSGNVVYGEGQEPVG